MRDAVYSEMSNSGSEFEIKALSCKCEVLGLAGAGNNTVFSPRIPGLHSPQESLISLHWISMNKAKPAKPCHALIFISTIVPD